MSYKNTIVGVTIGTRKQTICHFFASNNANCHPLFLINYISIYVYKLLIYVASFLVGWSVGLINSCVALHQRLRIEASFSVASKP
jgi:hypothetical protein